MAASRKRERSARGMGRGALYCPYRVGEIKNQVARRDEPFRR